jgi:hypothetical protein
MNEMSSYNEGCVQSQWPLANSYPDVLILAHYHVLDLYSRTLHVP